MLVTVAPAVTEMHLSATWERDASVFSRRPRYVSVQDGTDDRMIMHWEAGWWWIQDANFMLAGAQSDALDPTLVPHGGWKICITLSSDDPQSWAPSLTFSVHERNATSPIKERPKRVRME